VNLCEARHSFARLNFIRKDGLLASYYPDFIVKTVDKIHFTVSPNPAQTQLTIHHSKEIESILLYDLGVLVSTFFYTFVKTGFGIILQLFFISLTIISKHKIKLM